MVNLSVLRVGIYYKNPSKSVNTLSKLPYFVVKVLGGPKKHQNLALKCWVIAAYVALSLSDVHNKNVCYPV